MTQFEKHEERPSVMGIYLESRAMDANVQNREINRKRFASESRADLRKVWRRNTLKQFARGSLVDRMVDVQIPILEIPYRIRLSV